jgi:hypothetical protein
MRALALVSALILGASAMDEYGSVARGMTQSCEAKFNPPPIAVIPRASPSIALLTSCPLNGFSNQLLALLAAVAIAGDLGVSFWIPRLIADNLGEPPHGATISQHGAFCASCMKRMSLAEGSDIAEILNTSLLESVGGVRFDTDALLSKAFRRSRTVLDVCRAQQRDFPFAFSDLACADRPATFALQKSGGVKRPHRSFHLTGTTGAEIYSCVKMAVRAVLANASASGEALWIKFGATMHDYYRLCPRPPVSAPPFFRFNADVYSASARVFGRLAAGFPRHYEADHSQRACAHIRLSMPGEGWDPTGSPFTETAVSQIRSLRPWLKRAIEGHIPTLILTDAPWLLQRTVEEVGLERGRGCFGKGKCAFGDDLLDKILEDRLGHGVEVSTHFRTASMQLACASADRLLLTPKSSYSKVRAISDWHARLRGERCSLRSLRAHAHVGSCRISCAPAHLPHALPASPADDQDARAAAGRRRAPHPAGDHLHECQGALRRQH